MTLSAYLRTTGETGRAFARRAGVSHELIARVLRGSPVRYVRTARVVALATRGKVSIAEVLGLDGMKRSRSPSA